ncbi:unnamed protein product [Pleuronectes platessa]|uniref:Uncharacterized protein n=1 Tax=Pleuronectes platessa TaxID=8262 RepID=A0A9N7UI11_PLEPL|nr:unnamed protein product [Pleuronectes platessa]
MSRSWGSSRPVALLSTLPETRRAARRNVFWGGEVLFGGVSFSWTAGRGLSPVRKAGHWRGPGTAVGGSDSGRVSGLFADHLSYGARWGNPPFAGWGGGIRRCASAGA